jgi:hypothetical protein
MAATYIPIASTTLVTTAASVTFSAIPATYTDLVLRFSGRTSAGSGAGYTAQIEFNGDTSTNYSYRNIWNTSSTAVGSWSSSNDTYANLLGAINSNANTANTFSNCELYIPSYNSTANKPISGDTATEDNATSFTRAVTASLWRNSAAINQIKITTAASTFASGSSFFLYGIKNS